MDEFYPKKISARFHAPERVGVAANANAFGTSATFVCGTALRFSLLIDRDTKEIFEAKYQTNGCGFLIAAADVIAQQIVGRKLVELHGLDKTVLQNTVESELGKFGKHRAHCLDLCFETLQNALANFRAVQIEEFTGEKALICTCFGVSEETIENAINENALETVEEVIDVCRAGGGCGSCQPLIEDMLSIYRLEY